MPTAPADRRRASWRLLHAGAGPDVVTADGPTAMAIDHALMESVQAGGPPTLRLYRWSPPTLSFGRNQPARDLYDTGLARERGVAFVRRPTGGQAVLHDDELTYAVAAPVDVLGRPREAYRRINEALVAGLRELGLDASIAGDRPRPPRDWSAACFRAPAPGEVTVGGLKLVGSAQRYEGGAILQHGSILVGGSQTLAEELLHAGVAAHAAGSAGGAAGAGAGPGSGDGWTTLSAALGRRPSWDELSGAVVAGWSAVVGTGLAPGVFSVKEVARVKELRTIYASSEWTWRR